MFSLLLLPLVVITDPYKGINYDRINSYTINERCTSDCIEVFEGQEGKTTIASEDQDFSEQAYDKTGEATDSGFQVEYHNYPNYLYNTGPTSEYNYFYLFDKPRF